MPPQPIRSSAVEIDLSPRLVSTTTVVASPALAAETVIATLTNASFGDLSMQSGVRLRGWAAFTAGTSGTGATMRIRQTGTSGTLIVSSGLLAVTAAALYAIEVNGFDSAPGIGVYVLTLQIANGAAASTVSACSLAGDFI